MRKLYFLVPGTTRQFASGGLSVELKTMQMATEICEAEVVTYRQRETGTLYLPDLLHDNHRQTSIFVVSWGFDVPKLIQKLRSQPILYHAHSAGYRFQLPASVPIITVSRNTLGYWGQVAPHSPLYYLPNHIGDEFQNHHRQRDIDVLVHARKSSAYLLQDLVPALQQHCRVQVIEDFVDDLAELFNRSNVYLYDSAEYWQLQGVSEGFGLQPLEALACGCQVFSSVNGGLSDYLDPGFNSYKIGCYSKEYDQQQILTALAAKHPLSLPAEVLAEYRREPSLKRLSVILADVNRFFDHQMQHASNIRPLSGTYLLTRKWQDWVRKVQKRLKS
jgi:hypothetical protein